ncbi:MAG: glutaredoxin 3 [Bacillota bacterium]
MNQKNQPEIEIYTLKKCPFCRRAKSFLKSKELSYIEYNIDDSEETKQEMQERSGGAKTVPQIFIDGQSIGGYDDLLELKRTGKLDKMLDLNSEKNFCKIWDVVIIGSGPAGFSAALYAARKGLEVLIVSTDMGGQMVDTGEVDNYLGIIESSGPELIKKFWNHVEKYNVDIELGETVADVDKDKEKQLFNLKTESEKNLQSKTVIITTGTTNRELGIPGEKQFKGKGVHYCATCDGYLYAGEPVAVVGGGNAGLEASLDLAKTGCRVNLIEIQDELSGDQVLIDKVYEKDSINIYTGYGSEKIKGDNKVESLIIKNMDTEEKKELQVSGVFIEIGVLPNSEFIKNKVEVNEFNEIKINDNNETSIKGIWAAGDVTNIKDKQIIVAAGEGARTALRVNEFLNK